MNIDITHFFNNACAKDYSASVAEIGKDAGTATWAAACDDSGEYPLLDNEPKRIAFRDFVQSSGGWERNDIESWSDTKLNALCIQWVAGDMRNGGISASSNKADWLVYEKAAEAGQCSGSITRSEDGASVYFDIGV